MITHKGLLKNEENTSNTFLARSSVHYCSILLVTTTVTVLVEMCPAQSLQHNIILTYKEKSPSCHSASAPTYHFNAFLSTETVTAMIFELVLVYYQDSLLILCSMYSSRVGTADQEF